MKRLYNTKFKLNLLIVMLLMPIQLIAGKTYTFRVIEIAPDGNCFINALSTALEGTTLLLRSDLDRKRAVDLLVSRTKSADYEDLQNILRELIQINPSINLIEKTYKEEKDATLKELHLQELRNAIVSFIIDRYSSPHYLFKLLQSQHENGDSYFYGTVLALAESLEISLHIWQIDNGDLELLTIVNPSSLNDEKEIHLLMSGTHFDILEIEKIEETPRDMESEGILSREIFSGPVWEYILYLMELFSQAQRQLRSSDEIANALATLEKINSAYVQSMLARATKVQAEIEAEKKHALEEEDDLFETTRSKLNSLKVKHQETKEEIEKSIEETTEAVLQLRKTIGKTQKYKASSIPTTLLKQIEDWKRELQSNKEQLILIDKLLREIPMLYERKTLQLKKTFDQKQAKSSEETEDNLQRYNKVKNFLSKLKKMLEAVSASRGIDERLSLVRTIGSKPAESSEFSITKSLEKMDFARTHKLFFPPDEKNSLWKSIAYAVGTPKQWHRYSQQFTNELLIADQLKVQFKIVELDIEGNIIAKNVFGSDDAPEIVLVKIGSHYMTPLRPNLRDGLPTCCSSLDTTMTSSPKSENFLVTDQFIRAYQASTHLEQMRIRSHLAQANRDGIRTGTAVKDSSRDGKSLILESRISQTGNALRLYYLTNPFRVLVLGRKQQQDADIEHAKKLRDANQFVQISLESELKLDPRDHSIPSDGAAAAGPSPSQRLRSSPTLEVGRRRPSPSDTREVSSGAEDPIKKARESRESFAKRHGFYNPLDDNTCMYMAISIALHERGVVRRTATSSSPYTWQDLYRIAHVEQKDLETSIHDKRQILWGGDNEAARISRHVGIQIFIDHFEEGREDKSEELAKGIDIFPVAEIESDSSASLPSPILLHHYLNHFFVSPLAADSPSPTAASASAATVVSAKAKLPRYIVIVLEKIKEALRRGDRQASDLHIMFLTSIMPDFPAIQTILNEITLEFSLATGETDTTPAIADPPIPASASASLAPELMLAVVPEHHPDGHEDTPPTTELPIGDPSCCEKTPKID